MNTMSLLQTPSDHELVRGEIKESFQNTEVRTRILIFEIIRSNASLMKNARECNNAIIVAAKKEWISWGRNPQMIELLEKTATESFENFEKKTDNLIRDTFQRISRVEELGKGITNSFPLIDVYGQNRMLNTILKKFERAMQLLMQDVENSIQLNKNYTKLILNFGDKIQKNSAHKKNLADLSANQHI